MDKNLEIALLLDFYGDFLTKRQHDALRAHYEEDMSLAEIATEYGISRQGVRDSLVRGEAALRDMEQKLRLIDKYLRTKDALTTLREMLTSSGADKNAIDCADRLLKIWED